MCRLSLFRFDLFDLSIIENIDKTCFYRGKVYAHYVSYTSLPNDRKNMW